MVCGWTGWLAAEIDDRKVVAHFAGLITKLVGVTLPQLAEEVVSPTFDGCVIK
jgi:hypothetical protein